ncbi:aldehyde dehydrogenase family protein [Nonomuraea sp. NBC_00507]|uniref:aldehyde dehydrogenase family protein n=1 Tax=Nonomuraea sp. NBC_00507 TaxID=2976002 RepID=UPI0030E2AE86
MCSVGSLELGGKAPSIITRDADLAKAVPGNLQGALLNSGQVCKAYTPLLRPPRRGGRVRRAARRGCRNVEDRAWPG